MKTLLISALIVLIALGVSPVFATNPAVKSNLVQPLKVIAPDLSIETAEQGEFLGDPADPRHFKLSNVVGKQQRNPWESNAACLVGV